jgi:putative ABC transport system ATP-binding protein
VIDRVNRELGTTTAVITHNVAIAAMGDRVLHMSSGRIASETRNATRVSSSALEW